MSTYRITYFGKNGYPLVALERTAMSESDAAMYVGDQHTIRSHDAKGRLVLIPWHMVERIEIEQAD